MYMSSVYKVYMDLRNPWIVLRIVEIDTLYKKYGFVEHSMDCSPGTLCKV